MTLLLCSPACLPNDGEKRSKLVRRLRKLAAGDVQVAFLSNSGERAWFDEEFADSNVIFGRWPGRQQAGTLPAIAEQIGCAPNDILVLAASAEDVQMAKNGGGVLLAAGWSADDVVKKLGIQVERRSALTELVTLLSRWDTGWYYAADAPGYHVRSLSDVSGHRFTSFDQQQFGREITRLVKGGGSGLPLLLALTARSLEADGLGSALGAAAAYGIFPSSSSANDDSDVLSDFGHRLRTTVSRVRFAKVGEPLLVRHKPSAKRSAGGSGGDRTDPTEQLLTLHVSPLYRNKLGGRHVVVLDDCLTCGTSFGVAAALLRRAGAANVTGVALGKFGNQARGYRIEITGDPFAPLPSGAIGHVEQVPLSSTVSPGAQRSLIDLLG